MRTLAACLLALLVVPAAHAEDTTGFVRGIYYEASRGVLVDASMLRRASATRWVDVELADKSRHMVQLPAKMNASIGDLVAVQLGEPKTMAMASVLTVSRVTEVRPQSQLAGPAR
jgi:hypothetical protein